MPQDLSLAPIPVTEEDEAAVHKWYVGNQSLKQTFADHRAAAFAEGLWLGQQLVLANIEAEEAVSHPA